jgi:hypothetical protein
MAEFVDRELRGSQFRRVDLSGSRFREVLMVDVEIHNAFLRDVDITGAVENVRVNGVEIGPLVEAELDRQFPERLQLRPNDAAGFRAAWAVVEQMWEPTVARARSLPPDLVHERVDDEWSFVETLRHLVFATDAWVKAAVLGDPAPFDPLDLPHSEMPDHPNVPRDLEARPSFDEVLALRADRLAAVRELVAGLTDEDIARKTDPNATAGYPPPGQYDVGGCLTIVMDEEWWHRRYAERDLAVLEARAG